MSANREYFDEIGNRERVAALRAKGVEIWGPERVYISSDVLPHAIQPGAVLLNATIAGPRVGIGATSKIGISGTATIRDCQIGEGVEIGAGLFERATLLDGVKVRGFAELREGTLLEEQAELGHNVGLKNTVLTVAVVAGSLINFCDVFMTGGTSRSDHSEIGSGTVHFNFDPRGDKFGSILGDAIGFLLRSPRIFVGGNCGLVAPLHVDYGSVIAAGSTIRRDLGPNRITHGEGNATTRDLFDPLLYFDMRRKLLTTARLVGTMHALGAWYKHVRIPYAKPSQVPLYESAVNCLGAHINHRVTELTKTIRRMEQSLSRRQPTGEKNIFEQQHRIVVARREQIASFLLASDSENDARPPDDFLEEYARKRGNLDHPNAIRSLTPESAKRASSWLDGINYKVVRAMHGVFAGADGDPFE